MQIYILYGHYAVLKLRCWCSHG